MPDRPRIVVLGGGFGGVGAVKKLGDADADVLLVDKHDYHTFQPLLYQVATDLLEPPTVGHPLRDLFHDRPNVKVKQATVTGHRSGQAPGVVRRDEARLLRLPRARARGDRQLLRGRRRPQARLPDVHAARRRAPEGARARALDGGGSRPGPDRGRGAQRRHRRRRPDRRGERRRARRAVPAEPREGLPRHPAGSGTDRRGRGRGRRPVDVQEEVADVRREGAREAHRRDHARRGRREHRADARAAEVRNRAERPHADLGSGPAGQPARVRPRARAAAREPHPGRTRPHGPRPPGGVRRGRHRVDHRHQDQDRAPAARLGRAAGRRARRQRRSRGS